VIRIVAAVVLGVLALPLPARAHETGTGTPTGFVATVAAVEPNVVGLQARIVLGDQLLITNLSRNRVEILDRTGKPFIGIPAGGSRAWHDARVVGQGEPPPAAPGAPEAAPRFVKNWTVPGRTAGRAFAVRGFLGWVPPAESGDEGVPFVVLAGGALALVVLSAGAAYLLGRGRP
jgi:hypothetical protein